MEIASKNKVVFCTNKKYTQQEKNKIKSIVEVVTIDSKQNMTHINYNNWTNHNEYSKGY